MKRWLIIFLSGISWLFMGMILIMRGLNQIVQTIELDPAHSLCIRLNSFSGGLEQSASFLIAFGVFLGFLKGRIILRKTVEILSKKIAILPEPISFRDAYPNKYFIVIGGMILMGIGLQYMPIARDIYGTILLVIGSALMNGAFLFFRYSRAVKSVRN